MNIKKLIYFYELSKFKSINEASQNMNISQPALTKIIKDLETKYKIQLLNRDHRGFELTEDGNTFLKIIEPFLVEAENVHQSLRRIDKESFIINIGVPPMIASILTPDIMFDYTGTISIQEHGTNKLLELLDLGELDVIIIPNNHELLTKKYQYVTLFKTETVFCVHKNDSRYHNLKTIDISSIGKSKLILFTQEYYHNFLIKRLIEESDIEPTFIYYSDQIFTMLQYVRNNIANSFLIRELIEDEPFIVGISHDPKLLIDVNLVWKSQTESSKKMTDFFKYIKDQF